MYKSFNRLALLAVVFTVSGVAGLSQNGTRPVAGNAVLWEAADVSSRNMTLGPGGAEMQPVVKGIKYIGRQPGGNNLKHRLKDGNGTEWVVKVADESQPEVAAVRLLWAAGYGTEIDYLVNRLNISQIGSYKNARFEARPESIKRGERWSWTSNPFIGTRELDGLKIMMALINNWDLKDDNNVILQKGGKDYYIVSDLGSSFGKLSDKSMSRSNRSVSKPEDYARSNFIKGVNNGFIELDYRGAAEGMIKNIKVEHGRWLADILLQLSDQQISDAFTAANYKPQDVQIYSRAVRARINALDQATKPAGSVVAEQ